jgi:hypothetical protein
MSVNIGTIVAYVDCNSEMNFDLLKIERQEDETRSWIGQKFVLYDGQFYIPHNTHLVTVPMEFVICHNVSLTRNNVLAERSATSIYQALEDLEQNNLVYDSSVSSLIIIFILVNLIVDLI